MIVIDGNAVGYAAQHSTKLTVGDQEVQAIYQFLRTLKVIKARFGGKIVVLWDGKAQFRYDRYSEYKGKRNADDAQKAARESWQSQKPMLQNMLSSINVWQFFHSDFEADDLAGYLTRKVESPIQLITGDEDWIQLVNDNVSWHDIRSNVQKDCVASKLQEVTGFKTTTQFLYAKALQGDTSDNIKGVGGLGEKAGKAIFTQFKSLQELFDEHADTEDGFEKDHLIDELRRFRKKLNDFCTPEGKKLLARNLYLMDLKSGRWDQSIREGIEVTRPSLDMARFESQCRDLNFLSIANMIPDWRIFEKEVA